MKFAFIFPGQGSQSVGMLAKLAEAEPLVDQTFREASEVLGWDVLRVVREGPDEQLARTECTQPALLAASVAVWRVWRAHEAPRPSMLAGHSLGEYSALVVAGALDFVDALKLVEIRGKLMQSAVPAGTGGMSAVLGLDDAAVEALCKSYTGSGVLEPVNYNAPGQVVVAGNTEALDWLQANGKERGAKKITRLNVSVPSHCTLMKGAAEQLAEKLAQVSLRLPVVPVMHNLDARARDSLDGIRIALIEQLYRPVQWTQTIRAMSAQGVQAFVECGPGKVLGTLNKRILPEGTATQPLITEDPSALSSALQAVSATSLPA